MFAPNSQYLLAISILGRVMVSSASTGERLKTDPYVDPALPPGIREEDLLGPELDVTDIYFAPNSRLYALIANHDLGTSHLAIIRIYCCNALADRPGILVKHKRLLSLDFPPLGDEVLHAKSPCLRGVIIHSQGLLGQLSKSTKSLATSSVWILSRCVDFSDPVRWCCRLKMRRQRFIRLSRCSRWTGMRIWGLRFTKRGLFALDSWLDLPKYSSHFPARRVSGLQSLNLRGRSHPAMSQLMQSSLAHVPACA